jgi:hypothetical protein
MSPRRTEDITKRDVQNIAAVERGEMTAKACVHDSERRLAARESRRRRRHQHLYGYTQYYIDGVAHGAYVPRKTLTGDAAFIRYNVENTCDTRRHTADGRMNFERELNFRPWGVSSRRYEAAFLTPIAKRIYDYPNKKLDTKNFFKRVPKYV